MTQRIQVYAVVRVDIQSDAEEPAGGPGIPDDWLTRAQVCGISVQAVLPTTEEAANETERLNELNRDRGARYFWLATRYYPGGRGGEAE